MCLFRYTAPRGTVPTAEADLARLEEEPGCECDTARGRSRRSAEPPPPHVQQQSGQLVPQQPKQTQPV